VRREEGDADGGDGHVEIDQPPMDPEPTDDREREAGGDATSHHDDGNTGDGGARRAGEIRPEEPD
jgi:hypothetical protein